MSSERLHRQHKVRFGCAAAILFALTGAAGFETYHLGNELTKYNAGETHMSYEQARDMSEDASGAELVTMVLGSAGVGAFIVAGTEAVNERITRREEEARRRRFKQADYEDPGYDHESEEY